MRKPKFPTQAAFRAWRKKHPRTGTGGVPDSCPIARFARDSGFRGASFHPSIVRRGDPWVLTYDDEGGASRVLLAPKWAAKWARAFDLGVIR